MKMAPALRILPASSSLSAVAISRCSAAIRSASAGASSNDCQNDRCTEHVPALAGDVAARQRGELARDRRFDSFRKARIVGHQHGLRRLVVFGLRQQVGRDPFRIVVSVGDHEHFRRPRDAVDADGAEDLTLGSGHDRHCPARRFSRRASPSPCRTPAPRRPARRRCGRSRSTPHSRAAASTSGFNSPRGDGTTITMRGTPATIAGSAFMRTDDGYDAEPPGT